MPSPVASALNDTSTRGWTTSGAILDRTPGIPKFQLKRKWVWLALYHVSCKSSKVIVTLTTGGRPLAFVFVSRDRDFFTDEMALATDANISRLQQMFPSVEGDVIAIVLNDCGNNGTPFPHMTHVHVSRPAHSGFRMF